MRASGSMIDDQGKMNNFAVEPKIYVDEQDELTSQRWRYRTGFTTYAELLNGRLAMIGFVSLIVLKVFTGHGVLGLLANL